YKTRGMVKGIRILHDIYQMNYALAVVFKPNGSWRTNTAYDRIEYRKHFIPFADATTYWVTLVMCKKYAPEAKKYCDRGAGILEHVMGRYVAPRISDGVFHLATHHHAGDGIMMPEQPQDEIMYSDFENNTFEMSEE